jgi:hypothetical protein
MGVTYGDDSHERGMQGLRLELGLREELGAATGSVAFGFGW